MRETKSNNQKSTLDDLVSRLGEDDDIIDAELIEEDIVDGHTEAADDYSESIPAQKSAKISKKNYFIAAGLFGLISVYAATIVFSAKDAEVVAKTADTVEDEVGIEILPVESVEQSVESILDYDEIDELISVSTVPEGEFLVEDDQFDEEFAIENTEPFQAKKEPASVELDKLAGDNMKLQEEISLLNDQIKSLNLKVKATEEINRNSYKAGVSLSERPSLCVQNVFIPAKACRGCRPTALISSPDGDFPIADQDQYFQYSARVNERGLWLSEDSKQKLFFPLRKEESCSV